MARKKDQDVNVEIANVEETTTEITQEEVRMTEKREMPTEIRAIVDAAIAKADTWPTHIKGQIPYYNRARKILEAIRNGAELDTLRAMFKEYIPGSFSQVGAWMPRPIHAYLGRIIEDTVIVKTSGLRPQDVKTYEDVVSYEIRTGNEPPEHMDRMPGVICTCMRCGDLHAAKEPAHQLYCPKCSSLKPKASGRNSGVAVSKMGKDDQRMLAIVARTKRLVTWDASTSDAQAAMTMLNSARSQRGLRSLDVNDVKLMAEKELLS